MTKDTTAMQIIEDYDPATGWITAIIHGRWVQAKVYDKNSVHSVNEGRVSKIAIGKSASRNPYENFFEQICYNYDRGLDFDQAPSNLVKKIINELESLPKATEMEYA
jgi:hypothetical protein